MFFIAETSTSTTTTPSTCSTICTAMNNASNPASAPYTAIGIETITPSTSGGCLTNVTCSGYASGGYQDIYAYMVNGGLSYVREIFFRIISILGGKNLGREK